jgi:hypothetical protein
LIELGGLEKTALPSADNCKLPHVAISCHFPTSFCAGLFSVACASVAVGEGKPGKVAT